MAPTPEMPWFEYTPFGLLAAVFVGVVCVYKLYGLYNFETEWLLKFLEGQAVTFVLLALVLIDLSLMGVTMFLKVFPEGGCDVCQNEHDNGMAHAATYDHATCHDDDGKFVYGVMGSPSELEYPENSDTCFALEVYGNVMTIIYLVELMLKMICFYRIRTLASFFEERLCLIDFVVVSEPVHMVFRRARHGLQLPCPSLMPSLLPPGGPRSFHYATRCGP